MRTEIVRLDLLYISFELPKILFVQANDERCLAVLPPYDGEMRDLTR